MLYFHVPLKYQTNIIIKKQKSNKQFCLTKSNKQFNICFHKKYYHEILLLNSINKLEIFINKYAT